MGLIKLQLAMHEPPSVSRSCMFGVKQAKTQGFFKKKKKKRPQEAGIDRERHKLRAAD